MVYGKNLLPGSVINHHAHGWAVVDRVEPFGPGSTHADVWLVGVEKPIKIGIASTARRTPALRSTAALARKLWAEVRRLRSELEQAERQRDQARAGLEDARMRLRTIAANPYTCCPHALWAEQAQGDIDAAIARHTIGGNDHG